MSNYVFVIDNDKVPQNPIHPAQARKLLRDGDAAVFRRYPFTIILNDSKPDTKIKPLEVKIDPGSKTTGIAILSGENVIWGAELTHRGGLIKKNLDSRRLIRSNRRSRKTRYRPSRFLNRTRLKGWLTPSLLHRVLTIETWIKRLIKFSPIKQITQELVRFDLRKLEKPELSEVEYNQGELQGYEVREYLLNKWDRKCTYCGIQNVPLQIEHIHPKSKGGTNRISNLCLACQPCNLSKGVQDVKDFLSNKPDLLKKILSQCKLPLKDASAVNSTRWKLFNTLKALGLPIDTGSGGLTKFNRTRLELAKSHWIDAACVGKVNSLNVLINQPLLIKSTGHGTRQVCRTNKYGFPSCHVSRVKTVKGFRTGDIAKAIVRVGKKIGTYVGRTTVRVSGSFNISTSNGLIQGIRHKHFKLIHKKDGYCYNF